MENNETEDRLLDQRYVKKLANALVQSFLTYGICRLRCIGAAAISNADKAITIASSDLSKLGIDVVERKSFTSVNFNGREATAILKEIIANNMTKKEVLEIIKRK